MAFRRITLYRCVLKRRAGRLRGVAGEPQPTFWRGSNGDALFSGLKLVLDPRQTRVWSVFLDLATARMNSPEGAVRRIFHYPDGKEVR